jgi:hypothetical protein
MDMADVIVIFARGQSLLMDDESLAELFAATNIDRLIDGAIACTVPYCMIDHLERHPAVAYVRRVQAYMGSLES